jgi:hypothetical protein
MSIQARLKEQIEIEQVIKGAREARIASDHSGTKVEEEAVEVQEVSRISRRTSHVRDQVETRSQSMPAKGKEKEGGGIELPLRKFGSPVKNGVGREVEGRGGSGKGVEGKENELGDR